MVSNNERELANRLIKGTFLFETGVNLSIMFCLETIIVNAGTLPNAYSEKAIEHFQQLLASNSVEVALSDLITEEYIVKLGDNPAYLDSILSLLDGPLSFEIAFFFTVLDPDFRQSIYLHCLELVSRYRGSIPEKVAVSLIKKVLRLGEKTLFADKRFTVPFSDDKRLELEKDFKEYLGRYRASSQEEIRNQKIRHNDQIKKKYESPLSIIIDIFFDFHPFKC